MIPLLLLCASRPAAAGPPDPAVVLDRLDSQWRSGSTHAVLSVEVQTHRYHRTMKMEVWTLSDDRVRVTVLEPPREAGTTLLLAGGRAWQILPKMNRAIRLPAAMLGSRWMGTHLDNDDLLKASAFARDYRCSWRPPSQPDRWLLSCTPLPEAAVTYGGVEAEVRQADLALLALRYYDEDGSPVRTMEFSDFHQVGGQPTPFRVEVRPADEPQEHTTVIYQSLQTGVQVDPELFLTPRERRRASP